MVCTQIPTMIHGYMPAEPSRKVLDQCIQILLPDPVLSLREIRTWCWQHCESFVWCELADTSDVGYEYDSVAAFYFEDPADATFFKLKWQ